MFLFCIPLLLLQFSSFLCFLPFLMSFNAFLKLLIAWSCATRKLSLFQTLLINVGISLVMKIEFTFCKSLRLLLIIFGLLCTWRFYCYNLWWDNCNMLCAFSSLCLLIVKMKIHNMWLQYAIQCNSLHMQWKKRDEKYNTWKWF